ncbi:hypothetical protein [Leadbetterella sp. DM7]|uniref:hypothetical protein n=1 Tax=Leadbetterella sp. DM7 TaxID=3235085 RepID=UPI00349EB22E
MEAEIRNWFEYRVVKIHTVKFSFSDIDEAYVDSLLIDSKLNGELNVQVNVDREKSTMSFDITSHITDTQKNELLVQHVARTVYEVKGIDQVYTVENDSYNIPDNLIIQLYAIAFSHARALLATELSPTVFKDKYFLPVIDPKDILSGE